MDNPDNSDFHNPDEEATVASRPTMPLDESSLDNLPPEVRTTDPRAGGSGRLTFGIIAAALVIVAVVVVVLLLASSNNNDDESAATNEPLNPVPAVVMSPVFERLGTLENSEEVSQEDLDSLRDEIANLDTVPQAALTPIFERIATLENVDSVSPEDLQALRDEIAQLNPVPAVVLTPILERIATLENTDSVSPEELQALRDEVARLDQDNITVDDLNAIINRMDSQFVDGGELRQELDTMLGSNEFSQSVLGVIDEANQQATQTQAAIECVITTLPAYPSVRVHMAPSTTSQTRDFIVSDREYKVVGRTNGELNTDKLWWLIEIDVRNQINGWVSSDLVEESNDENCMNIVVMPVGN